MNDKPQEANRIARAPFLTPRTLDLENTEKFQGTITTMWAINGMNWF